MKSGINYTIVKSSLKCDCEPYRDVKTYKAWQAEGEQVVKGEKGIRVTTYIEFDSTGRKPDDPDYEPDAKRPWHAYVFCRHQLESFKKTGKVAEAKPKPAPDKMYPVAEYVME